MSDDDEVVSRRRYMEEEARADKAEAERDAALAQVEALRTIRSLCRGCLKPMKEHPPGPPCQPFLPGPLRAAGSALFRLVDAALSSHPAPAVSLREQAERAAFMECCGRLSNMGHANDCWHVADAQPDAEVKP